MLYYIKCSKSNVLFIFSEKSPEIIHCANSDLFVFEVFDEYKLRLLMGLETFDDVNIDNYIKYIEFCNYLEPPCVPKPLPSPKECGLKKPYGLEQMKKYALAYVVCIEDLENMDWE
jgi:hypothetical protein